MERNEPSAMQALSPPAKKGATVVGVILLLIAGLPGSAPKKRYSAWHLYKPVSDTIILPI